MLYKLSSILHTLSCTQEHEEQNVLALTQERNPDKCYYYLEEVLPPGASERIDHKKWEDLTRELCNSWGSTPEQILRVLPQLLDIRQRIDAIREKFPNAEELLRLILG